ncbi:MAG: hypothetical protein A2075_00135 [Geobacteraceae bacterium GWC2_58_44]|nr:MAG: hypothetical protein A2075_00135 [Geobacteraceae bacterium GWC2_58_44]HBG06847.1 hypothetical protein [Geobacter sp.]
MPIEIRELHIRVAVNAAPGGARAAASAGGALFGGAAGSDEAQDAMVAECVEQVLQILQSKMER